MNWFVRNLAVLLFGAMTTVLTAMGVIILEARTGVTIFGLSFLRLVPLGAIAVGLVGCVGYLLAAHALRLWPGVTDVVGIVAVAAGVVFLVQSAEFEIFWGGPTQAAAATRHSGTFVQFLDAAVAQSPLNFWGTSDGDDSASAVFFSGGPSAMSRVSGGDSRTEGISEGVSGMMASEDPSNSAAAKHVNDIGAGITNVENKVKNRGSMWTLLVVQMLGVSLGGLAVFGYLRSLPHCASCMLLLTRKGRKTRYFSRSREMRNAVDEVLVRAREKQLQQSILMHTAKGSEKKQNWSEFCATLEIRRCMQCNTHRVHYHAQRKDGATWKNIALLGFTSTTLEPVDFAKS